LTLGDLWCGGPATADDLANRLADPRSREINYEVLTTSLTHGRPYRIPFSKLPLWFYPADLEPILPARIVQAIVNAGKNVKDPRAPVPPEGAIPLPPAEYLPVVFLARMSLSFPFLLSAPKFLGVRYTGGKTRSGDLSGDNERADPAPRGDFQPMWFSDGGIASNFPIHFFDQLIPDWPTFGLDLGEAPADTKPEELIRLPRTNLQGILATWLPIEGLSDFARALMSSLQAWMDNMQKRAPGYRDRIVQLLLTPEEGGLNLEMPAERILAIADRGRDAGSQLGEWFDPTVPSSPAQPKPYQPWDNQRWIRLRSMLAVLEQELRTFQTAYVALPPGGARSYANMLAGEPPSYDYRSAGLLQAADALVKALLQLKLGQGPSLATGAPRPEPDLRIVPKV
jgi:hypothetical protein